MYRRLTAAGLFSVMALWASLARAEQVAAGFTGTDLLSTCEAQDGSQHAYCLGYIGGIADVVLTSGRRSPVTACISPSVTKDQIVEVTLEYLRDHPREVRSYSAAVLVLEAIRKAFRCR